MHIKLLENSIVDFLSFYNYNLIHKTKINTNNSLIFADRQFGTSTRMLMSYPSIVYIISLYHSSKNDKVVSNKFIPTNSYISIEDIEKLKHTNLEKVDYLVIVERTDSTISDIDTLMKNILFVTNKSNKISYNISTAEAKAVYSSLDDRKKLSRAVEINFYNEELYPTVESKSNCERTTSKEKVVIKRTHTTIPMNLILCNNNFFYNVLCVLVFISTFAIIGVKVYYNGITKFYHPMAIASIVLAIVLISVLQYIRIDNNKKKK